MYSVSVVIPIFQVERYISDCVQALINQTYKDFYVILVNDGSMDRSAAIAEQMLTESSINYKLINKQNGGLPSARNGGLQIANTKWVISIDSDDVIHPGFIESLVNAAERYECDIAFCDWQEVKTDELWKDPAYDNGITVYPREEFQRLYIKRSVIPAVATMILRNDWIHKNNLFLDTNCLFGGDQHYIWKISFDTDHIVHVRKPLYNYLKRPDSIITAPNIKKVKQNCDCMQQLGTEMHNRFPKNKSAEFITSRCLMGVLNTLAKYCTFQEFKEVADYAESTTKMKQLLHFPDFKVQFMSRVFGLDERLYYILIRGLLGNW